MNGSVRFAVHQCASSSQDSRMWTELDVSKSTAAASAVTRASAQAKGKEIAGSAKVGEHVIAQTRSDDTDQFALGVFVDAGKGSPVIAHATKRGKLRTKFGSVLCNDGDVFSPSSGSIVMSRMPSAGRFTNRVTRTRLAV
jgi:hypothetical protein